MAFQQLPVFEFPEIITKVVLAIAFDGVAVEILTADRAHKNGGNAQSTSFVNVEAEHVAVGGIGASAASIGEGRQTIGCVVSGQFEVVRAVRYGAFVVVRKLDKQVVACCHLTLY